MASSTYNLGVRFVGQNKVSPALKTIQVDSSKTAAKVMLVGSSIKSALSGFQGRGLGLGGVLGVSTALFGLQRGIRGVVTEAGRFEVANIQFAKLIGNADLALKTMREMETFAARTPFEFKQSQEISKGLLAAGVGARELIPVMRKLGDLGMGNPEKVDQLALAYSKVRMTGKATWRELRMFATAGVPIFDQMRSNLNLTQEGLERFVRQGKAKFPVLQKAITDLSAEGGKFHGMMVNMMSTVPGLWSNFKDIVDQVSRRLGMAFQPALKMVILQMTNAAAATRVWVEKNQELIASKLGGFLSGIAEKIKWASQNMDIIIGRLGAVIKFIKIAAVAMIGFKVGIAVLGILASAFQIAGAAALVFGAGSAVAFAPLLAVIAAVVLGIGAVIWGMNKLGLISGYSPSGILSSLKEEFSLTNPGLVMPDSPLSMEGQASVSREESNSTSTQTANVNIRTSEGLLADTDDDMPGLSFGTLETGNQLGVA